MLVLVLSGAACERSVPPAGDATTATGQTADEDRPNIVLITIESLRADHVGCYGYERDTTPNLDRLAGEATLYTDAHAVTSWTLTSHASLFTGLYPSAHQVILPKDRLGNGYVTLAEALSAAGYQCAGVISGPYLRRPHNLHQGFEHYDESVSATTDTDAHKDVTNPGMEEAVRRFLRDERDPGRPFFLFAYYWDVHYDYIPPPPYDTMFVPDDAERIESVQFSPLVQLDRDISPAQLRYLVAQYDGEIRCTDEYLGRVWALLKELGLWESTAVIVTADHGEEFFDHGFLGHKHHLYAESVHVPLLVKWPGQSAAERDGRLVNLVDLYPTILELAEEPPGSPHSGHSLLKPPVDDRISFHELVTTWNLTNRETGEVTHDSDRWQAIRRGRHKLLHVEGTSFWQLYDVEADPQEMHALGAAHQATAVALRDAMVRWQDEMKALGQQWEAGGEAELDAKELERLRSLGYVR